MAKHYYTIEEANKLLPQIQHQMAILRQAKDELALMRLSLARKQKAQKENEDSYDFFKEEAEIEFSLISTRQQIAHLHTLSIVIKDIDHGLVDFLALIDGKDAYLCWRDGEPNVRYWHGIEEGFSGRKPLQQPPS